jgi:transglutaminase-like putative cysteine protease
MNDKEARIAVFKRIRDIPYAIVPAMRDPAVGPCMMLKENRGSCNPKHVLLADEFRKLGLEVRYANYAFYWDDPAVKYPPELRALTKKLPAGNHLAVKALIEGKWVLVDATWDLPLKKAGFPVNEGWDGVSDTRNAVTPINEVLNETIEERVKYDTALRSKYTDGQKAAYAEFMDKLNKWLEELRA